MDRRVILIALLALAVGLALIAYRQVTAEPVYYGLMIEPAQPAADFELTTDAGTVHLSDYRGKWVLLYFGYTYCPDVCPTTLSTLKRALNEIGQTAGEFQVLFISVDPRRDTPAHLGEYVRFFNSGFVGATGTVEQINLVTSQFGIAYHINDAESTESYTVDHTSVVIAIDPGGAQRMVWNHETLPDEMAADMKNLVREEKRGGGQ